MQSDESLPNILTVKEVADHLRVCAQTVYNLINAGKLVGRALGVNGDAMRIKRDDLEAYIEACKTSGGVSEKPAVVTPRPAKLSRLTPKRSAKAGRSGPR